MIGAILKSVLKLPQPTRCATEIDRLIVSSCSIAAVGFHAGRGILQIEYKSGVVFEAEPVKQSEFDNLWKAQDFDSAFSDTILAHHQLHRVGYQYPVFLG